MKTCYIYTRTATETQPELSEGHSKAIARQIDQCRNYAQKRGYSIVETFEDIGCSGNNYKRKSLQRLFAHCKKYSVGAVITLSIDRLSRNFADFAKIQTQLTKKDIRLISVHEGDLSSGVGKFAGTTSASIAQSELERSKLE